jgi:ADP-heptose:LPS heptosyltransferase
VVHLSEIWRPRELRFVRQLAPQQVVGLDDELQMINVKLGQATKEQHFSERLLPWLEQLGIDTSNRQYWVPRSQKAAEKVVATWPACKVVGLCPYGASKSRQFSAAQIRFVANLILANPNTKLLMIVRPDQAGSITEALGIEPWFDRVFFQTTDDLFEVCEQVAKCEAIVSVDTAIVHIASGLQKPLLALYALHHNQFDMWRAISPKATCQFVVMGREAVFDSSEISSLERGITQILNKIEGENNVFN